MPNTSVKPSSEQHPLIGWMKGTVKVEPGVDLTEPTNPHWGKIVYSDRTLGGSNDRKV